MWLGFAPHALGRSDRQEALKEGRNPWIRVRKLAQAELHPDPATLAVLIARAREQALVYAALGDRQALSDMLDEIATLAPDSRFPENVRSRLARERRGGIDVTGLYQIY